MIEVKHVTKTYGKKNSAFKALDDVSFTIPDGASVAIVGKSGSGKSTLMHAMSGLDRPESGQVVIDGVDILKLKQKKVDSFRSGKIGFIFQSFFVQANETCADNVALPLEITRVGKRSRKQLIEEALETVELGDKIKQKARNLSGGQKQRLAIARAIVNRPRILFADEPTGNLDSTTGEKIEDLLFTLNADKGSTLIIVTHDADLASRCDTQIYIKDGVIERIEGVPLEIPFDDDETSTEDSVLADAVADAEHESEGAEEESAEDADDAPAEEEKKPEPPKDSREDSYHLKGTEKMGDDKKEDN